MAFDVIEEARRCLNCPKPLCRTGCPANTAIPQAIQMLLQNKMEEAGKMLFENNPLSMVCGLVCNHENQCEGHCILARKGNPIHFGDIEHYISSFYIGLPFTPYQGERKEQVAIIGSGPAGLTIAIKLAEKGYRVTIFEAHEKIGGVMQYGIPAFRLPKDILENYHKRLLAMGIKIRPNVLVGAGSLSVDDLFRDGYKAIFVGTGVWNPLTLGIEGESLGSVHYAINYLKNPESFDLGNKVVIIGAGNSAIDVARTALRHGSRHVSMFLRSTEKHVRSSKKEMEHALAEGARLVGSRRPLRITDEGVIFVKTETLEDEAGRVIEIKDIPGSEELEKADSVIIAISQGPRNFIVSNGSQKIDVDKRGFVSTNEQGHTTRKGVFAAGDVVTGAKTVVEAMQLAKTTAGEIEAYIKSLREG
jgi:glutamate synthase (NADPH/NADH) small chain